MPLHQRSFALNVNANSLTLAGEFTCTMSETVKNDAPSLILETASSSTVMDLTDFDTVLLVLHGDQVVTKIHVTQVQMLITQ